MFLLHEISTVHPCRCVTSCRRHKKSWGPSGAEQRDQGHPWYLTNTPGTTRCCFCRRCVENARDLIERFPNPTGCRADPRLHPLRLSSRRGFPCHPDPPLQIQAVSLTRTQRFHRKKTKIVAIPRKNTRLFLLGPVWNYACMDNEKARAWLEERFAGWDRPDGCRGPLYGNKMLKKWQGMYEALKMEGCTTHLLEHLR